MAPKPLQGMYTAFDELSMATLTASMMLKMRQGHLVWYMALNPLLIIYKECDEILMATANPHVLT